MKIAAMLVVSAFSFLHGMPIQPKHREIMVVERYDYDEFIKSFNTQDNSSIEENPLPMPQPTAVLDRLKRRNSGEPAFQSRRRLFTNVDTEIPLPAPTPEPDRSAFREPMDDLFDEKTLEQLLNTPS